MAIAAFVGAPRKLVMVGFVAIIAAVLFNVVLSTYHAGIEWRWWAGPPDCTGPVTDFKAGGGLLGQLQTIHVPRCDEAAWRFLGISLAGYNVLISLALVAFAGYGLLAREPAGEACDLSWKTESEMTKRLSPRFRHSIASLRLVIEAVRRRRKIIPALSDSRRGGVNEHTR